MFPGTHKFAENLFLPTECALDQFRLRWVNPDLVPVSISPLIGGAVRGSAVRIEGGHYARGLHARARGSLASLFALSF